MTFSLIASNAGIGSTSIDSTGADLIVVWHSFDSSATLTDSRNTLTALDEHFEANGGTKGRLFYYRGTNVGSSHTFTSSLSYGLVAVEAWSGSAAADTLVDQDGAGTASGLFETLAPGSVTAAETNCLVVCGLQLGGNSVTSLALSSSFTIEEHVQASSGVNYGGAIAHKVLSSAGTESPVWTWGNTRSAVSGLAVFLAADSASATGPTIDTQPTAQTANEPATATFTVSATTSGGTLHYQWKRADPGSGTFSNVGTDSNSYTTGATSAASDHGASYKVDVTDDNGTTVSDTVVLTVRSTNTVARPSADVSATGWTASSGSDLFAMIDESSASDADYITSPTITGSTAPATFTLAYPLNTGSWTLSVRAKTSTGTATLRLYLLNDANTVVGTSGDQTITSSFTTYQLAVTSSGPATRARVEIVS